MRASSDETVLLGNGCVCCTTRSDLQIALRRLIAERERGTVPHFRRVVIETSGLADPGPLLATFATDRALGAEFSVDVVIAVADAVTGTATLEWSAEARKQIILADRLVVTKGDLAEPDAIEALQARLAALNPRAAIAHAVNGSLDPQAFLAPADAACVAPRLRGGSRAQRRHCELRADARPRRSTGYRSPRRWRP